MALGALAVLDLERAGLRPDTIGMVDHACTACDERRFHSYRRDGANAGRLFHFVTARPARLRGARARSESGLLTRLRTGIGSIAFPASRPILHTIGQDHAPESSEESS